MKKYQMFIVTILLAFIGCGSVLAAPATTIREMEPDEELFIEDINDFLDSSFCSLLNYEIENPIDLETKIDETSPDEIYTTNSYKIYSDLSIFYAVDSLSKETMDEMIRDARYFYLVMLYREQGTALLTFNKGLPLSEIEDPSLPEDVIEDLRKVEGRWHVVSYSANPVYVDYDSVVNELLSSEGISDAEIYYVAGNDGYQHPMAVCCSETKGAYVITLEDDAELGATGTICKYETLREYVHRSNLGLNTGDSGYGMPVGDIEYKFKIENVLKCITILVVLIIAGGTIVIWKNRKRQ